MQVEILSSSEDSLWVSKDFTNTSYLFYVYFFCMCEVLFKSANDLFWVASLFSMKLGSIIITAQLTIWWGFKMYDCVVRSSKLYVGFGLPILYRMAVGL